MNKSLRIALAAPLLIALAGCGAKGPLILPDKTAPLEVPAEAPTDNTPQINDAVDTPADEKAEEPVENPATPATND